MKNIIKNNKGVTLLLSLIIMMNVVAIAIGLSMLIINLYQFSAHLDHAYVAYYAAESGMETQLLEIKNSRADDLDLNSDVMPAITNDNNIVLAESGGRWDTSQSTASQDYLLDSLEQNKSTSFDVEGAHSIKLTWNDDCQGDSWLEYSFVPWQNDLPSTNPSDWKKNSSGQDFVFPCEENQNLCETSTKNLPNNLLNYTISITPLYCDVSNLKVKAYSRPDLGGDLLNLSNRIYLKSVGSYHDSQKALAASIPYRLPPQGIFNFVLFSEQTIEKK
ncbi:MAG: hypothetical protein U5L76_00250 [Patescibacteria group bacterium]|nr:hypothetical protein [Patescibacteria group bacterium]